MSTDVVFALVDRHADRSTPQVSIGRLPALEKLRTELERRGYRCVPFDTFSPNDGAPTIALWDYGSLTSLPSPIADAARGRIVSWSLESPLVAHRSFHRLDDIGSASRYVFAFPGAERLLADPSSFRPLYWPNTVPPEIPDDPWGEREFLVMINSDKGVGLAASLAETDVRDPVRSLRVLASSLVGKSYRLRRSWTVPNYYDERLDAIRYFAGRDGFHLFGSGWESRTRRSGTFASRLAESYKGTVADKIATLSRYRFTLCYENTAFEGYITEKIFDAFFSGSIPVYLGAPDVARYIPSDTYIDASHFSDHAGLETHLRSMSPSEAEGYRTAARTFVRSTAMERFTDMSFVSAITDAVESVARPR